MPDPVGIYDDGAFFGLAEDLLEFECPDDPGLNQIRKNVSGSDRRELKHVPDQDQGGGHGNSLQQMEHELGIHHRGFIHNHGVHIQGVVLIFFKIILFQIIPQKLMQGEGFFTGHLGKTPGRASRRRGEDGFLAQAIANRGDGTDQGGLSGPRPAGDDGNVMQENFLQHGLLLGGKLNGQARQNFPGHLLLINIRGFHRNRQKRLEPKGNPGFRPVKRRKVKGLLNAMTLVRIGAITAHRFPHHLPFIGKRQHGGGCRFSVNVKEPGAFSPDFLTRHEHMAIGCRLFQQIQNAGPDSHRIIGKGALLLRDPVGDIKTDSRNITGDLVRMILKNTDCGRAVLFEYTAGISQRNAVVLEKNHQASNQRDAISRILQSAWQWLCRCP